MTTATKSGDDEVLEALDELAAQEAERTAEVEPVKHSYRVYIRGMQYDNRDLKQLEYIEDTEEMGEVANYLLLTLKDYIESFSNTIRYATTSLIETICYAPDRATNYQFQIGFAVAWFTSLGDRVQITISDPD